MGVAHCSLTTKSRCRQVTACVTADSSVPFAGESPTQGRQMGNDLLLNLCFVGHSQRIQSGILYKSLLEVEILILLPNVCYCFDAGLK